jgi:hypothetical protein
MWTKTRNPARRRTKNRPEEEEEEEEEEEDVLGTDKMGRRVMVAWLCPELRSGGAKRGEEVG